MEIFQGRSERMEYPLKMTAEELILAFSGTKSRNANTLLDWLDLKLAVEDEDPPIIDMKYFAEYDPEIGFKISVDGIHNIPHKKNVFYVVIMSLNPPSSLYMDNQAPTDDVNIFNLLLTNIGSFDSNIRLGLQHLFDPLP